MIFFIVRSAPSCFLLLRVSERAHGFTAGAKTERSGETGGVRNSASGDTTEPDARPIGRLSRPLGLRPPPSPRARLGRRFPIRTIELLFYRVKLATTYPGGIGHSPGRRRAVSSLAIQPQKPQSGHAVNRSRLTRLTKRVIQEEYDPDQRGQTATKEVARQRMALGAHRGAYEFRDPVPAVAQWPPG